MCMCVCASLLVTSFFEMFMCVYVYVVCVGMCFCVYLYVCVCVYVTVCLCVYVSMCLCIWVSVWLCVCVSVCLWYICVCCVTYWQQVNVCDYVYIYVYVCVCMSVCLCVCMSVCLCVCVSVCLCAYGVSISMAYNRDHVCIYRPKYASILTILFQYVKLCVCEFGMVAHSLIKSWYHICIYTGDHVLYL